MTMRCILMLFLLIILSNVSAAEKLIPASFSHQNDALSFRWDISTNGTISDGTNDCFDSGFMLRVRTKQSGLFQFQGGYSMMTPDGSEKVLTQDVHNLKVTRRLKLFKKEGIMRYVEIVKNKSNTDLDVVLQIYTNVGGSAQKITLSEGKNLSLNNQMLPISNKSNWMLVDQQSNRPSILHMYGKPIKNKLDINFQGQSSSVTMEYKFKIKQGATVAIAHMAGQRHRGQAVDKKKMKNLQSYKYYRDLPKEIQRALINRAGLNSSFLKIADIDQLQIDRQAVDVLAMGESTVLRGVAQWEQANMKTHLGERNINFEQVAAVAGPTHRKGKTTCFLRDGQILIGELDVKGFSFHLSSGFKVLDNVEKLDRIVAGGLPVTGPYPTGWSITTQDGMRLLVNEFTDATLELSSPWGAVQIVPQRIHYLRRLAGDKNNAWLLQMQNGIRIPVYPTGNDFTFKSQAFGSVNIPLSEIISVDSPNVRDQEDFDEHNNEGAVRIMLKGEYILAGGIVNKEITVLSGTLAYNLPLTQVRAINRNEDEFIISFWDGSEAIGSLISGDFILQIEKLNLALNVDSIESIKMPRPALKPAQRAHVIKLLAQLGNNDWKKRDEASAALGAMGSLIEDILRDHEQQTKDPEIAHRIKKLLKGIDDQDV